MTNKWITHVKAYHAKHPKLTYGEAMKQAKATYKQSGKGAKLDKLGNPSIYAGYHDQNVQNRQKGKGKFEFQYERRPIGIVPDMRRPEKIEKFKGF
jgi:hypothetical protein